MNNEQIKIIRDFLKGRIKENLSDIEKDILDTADEILKKPFDYKSASFRVGLNFKKYRIVDWVVETQPQAQWKTLTSEDEVINNLRLQLEYLCKIYSEEHNNG